ncbi:hypothetical protein DHEL01_v207080 [Diaporthe helianthi]|uniref:Uncharacterized protein n=1 Tax=Diaporthe helianthi TaxID=158607 RepID=A0A2P5HW96_DIAHE|nr:hypothetical protein DHEL01_v207080 [Diaporthe helianthi]
MLSSLIRLTKQIVLAIHVEQHQIPDQNWIERLCQAFCNGSVTQHHRHSILGDFYKGRGAIIVNDPAPYASSETKPTSLTVDGSKNARGVAISPPYAEAPPPPPSIFASKPSNKRQRVTADASTAMLRDVDSVYTELLAQQRAQMDKFFSLQQAQMADVLARMGTQVDKMPKQVMTQVDKRINEEMGKIWDKKPREWEGATRNIVQQEVDYALETSLPDKLEELQDAIMDKCLDRLQEELEGGLVTITLPRP